MWLSPKKHIWRKFIFLVLGIAIGLLMLNQYKAQKQVKQLTSRDSAISFVNFFVREVLKEKRLCDQNGPIQRMLHCHKY